MKYLLLAAAALFCGLTVLGDQTFTQDKMNVRYMRGASVADDPTAPSGKVAKVGRDWSVQWFLEPRKPVTMDYTRTYDVLALCKGDFTMGIYGVQRSGYVTPYRRISTPEWKQIRLVRDRLHPRDYLTTDGMGKPGSIAAVTFVEHPLSPEEIAVQKENLPGVHLDAEQAAQISFQGVFNQPVELLTGMGKDKFCPAPEVIVETVSKSGKIRSSKVTPGVGRLIVQPGAQDDPVVQLVFRTTGKTGRTIADIAFRTPENPGFRIFSHSASLGEVNCYDVIRTNEQLRLFCNRSNFNAAREKLFAGRTGSFAVIPESTMRKVFEYDIRPEWKDKADVLELNLSLARREAEHLQLVLLPQTDKPETLKVRWIPQDSKAPEVKFEKVDYIRSDRRAYPQVNERTASYPDPLLPLEKSEIRLNGKNQPLWITVEADGNTKPGTYSGKLVISGESGTEAVMMLNISVRKFSLPERSQFRTCFFLNRVFMLEYFGIKDWQGEKAMSRKIIEISAKNRLTLMPMLEHRPTWLQPNWTATKDAQGKYHFDFTKENEITRMILDEFHGTGYNVAPSPTWDRYFGYMWLTDPKTGKAKRLPYSMKHPEFQNIYRDFLQAAWENAKKNGWEKYAYHYIWDESNGPEWNRLYMDSRKFAPELKTLAVGYKLQRMTPETVEAVNIWCPLTANFNPDFAAERVKKGNESWCYVCVIPKNRYNLFIDHEAFTHRALLWWCRTRKITGLLYWGVCFWDQAVRTRKQTGKVWPEIQWNANQYQDGNGDGYLVYPDARNGRIYSSLRLAVLRDGLEDMEYFLLLDAKKAEAAQHTEKVFRNWLKEVNRAEAEIPQVIAGETRNDGKRVAHEYNGEQLESVREKIGALLDQYPGGWK